MTTTFPPIQHIADAAVDDALDLELRALLSTCFTGPQDSVFKHRRYFNEPPAHRWCIRGEDGTLAAHLAVHERTLLAEGRSFPVGGLAEVCVHPSYRGRGYLKALVAEAHRWLKEHDYAFAVLFGDSRYYASSGYIPVTNMDIDGRDENGHLTPRRAEGALVLALSDIAWPQTDNAYLSGLYF